MGVPHFMQTFWEAGASGSEREYPETGSPCAGFITP
jgi:hypothetical protein